MLLTYTREALFLVSTKYTVLLFSNMCVGVGTPLEIVMENGPGI